MGHTAFGKRHRNHGYVKLNTIRCDCGNAASHQVQVQQFNSNDNRVVAILPLCESCYQLMLAEDKGVLRAW